MALALLAVGILGGGLAFSLWGAPSAGVVEAVILCLALGFWITERLIGVFTQTIQANPTAILILFTGKLAWWAMIFIAARHMPAGYDRAVGLGIGAFLVALFAAMVRHYGMPRISDGNPPEAP
jgi:hypothetical protein